MSNGKGSSRRPHDVPTDTVADNWARTFGVTQPTPDVTECPHLMTYGSGVNPVFRCVSCGKAFP
jgi:hypothetical protein